MAIEPILVKVRLATPIAINPHPWRHNLCLDAILSGLLVARGHHPSELPLQVEDGLAYASQVFIEQRTIQNTAVFDHLRRTVNARRCFNNDTELLAPNRHGQPATIGAGTSEGQIKAISSRYAVIPAGARLYWFAHGDLEHVRRLMAWIGVDAPDGSFVPGYGIGRAGNAGNGEAAEVSVQPLGGLADAAIEHAGQPTRPIPLERWLRLGHSLAHVRQAPVAWRYPYYATPPAMCVVPPAQVLDGGFRAHFRASAAAA